MKRRTIIVVIALLVTVSLLTPYLAPDGIKTYLSNVSTLIGMFATLVTLVLAMILYNQIGLDQSLLQRKADVVFALLNLLSERSFIARTNQGFNVMIHLTNISERKDDYERFGNLKLLFTKDYLEYIAPIINLQHNVFLPQEFFQTILRLEAVVFQAEREETINNPKYACLDIYDRKPITTDDYPDLSSTQWGLLAFPGDGRNLIPTITMNEFIARWDDLIISSVKWINKYSSYQKLNIPFSRNYYNQKK